MKKNILMNDSVNTGFSFGLTSGIITTLGLMVGLYSGTHSKLAVLGGILTIAIADAFSDALGIHISEEAENKHTTAEIWQSTISTFVFKFISASMFIIPVLLFSLSTAVIVSIIFSLLVLSGLSIKLARDAKENPFYVVAEHLAIAVAVIILTHLAGHLIASMFG